MFVSDPCDGQAEERVNNIIVIHAFVGTVTLKWKRLCDLNLLLRSLLPLSPAAAAIGIDAALARARESFPEIFRIEKVVDFGNVKASKFTMLYYISSLHNEISPLPNVRIEV